MDTKEAHTFINQIEGLIIFRILITTFIVVGIFYLVNKYLNSKNR